METGTKKQGMKIRGSKRLNRSYKKNFDKLIGSSPGLLYCIFVTGLFVVSIYPQKTNESKAADQKPALQMSGSQPLIVLERGRCFGTCPAYRVTIFSDGNLIYEGFDFVKIKGRG